MVGRFTETLGQYLKRERESRSMSLEELSRATRIGLPFLEALERDDFDFFPQRDFIRGFLKGYTRHLGLEVEEVLRRYRIQSEMASRKENFQQMPLFPDTVGLEEETQEPKPDFPTVPQPLQKRKRSYWKILLQIIIVSVALGLSWYIRQLLKNSEKGERTPSAETTFSEKAGNESNPAKMGSRLEEKLKGATVQERKRVVGNRVKKIYYLPGMKDYEKVNPGHRVDFESEQEAIKAGYRRSPQ